MAKQLTNYFQRDANFYTVGCKAMTSRVEYTRQSKQQRTGID